MESIQIITECLFTATLNIRDSLTGIHVGLSGGGDDVFLINEFINTSIQTFRFLTLTEADVRATTATNVTTEIFVVTAASIIKVNSNNMCVGLS